MWDLIPTKIRAQKRRRALNENVRLDFSPDSDGPNVQIQAKRSCSYRIIQVDLLLRSRSWFPRLTRPEKHAAPKASRRESRQRKRCRHVDQLCHLSIVQ